MKLKKHIKQIIIIIILLSSINLFAQEEDYMRLSSQRSYGCHTIDLYNDSTFLFSTGCEVTNIKVSCGRWEMSGDTILMEKERNGQVRSVLKERDPLNDSTIVLTVLDRNDEPISINTAGFPDEIHHSLFRPPFYPSIKIPVYGAGREILSLNKRANKHGYTEFPIKYTDNIKLLTLLLFDEDFVIDVNGFNRITVKLNANPKILNYPSHSGPVEEYPDKIVTEDGKMYYLKVKKEQ